MPVTHAAAKSLRQSKRRAAKNAAVKVQLRYLLKQTRRAVSAKSVDSARSFFAKTIKAYDKAVQNRIVKRNTAARIKSRLAHQVNALVKPS